MPASHDHLACPTWKRWWSCRFTPEFDRALRDWTLVISDSLRFNVEGPGLWRENEAPIVQWDPSPVVNGYAELVAPKRPRIVTTIGAHARIHEFAYRLFSTSDLCAAIGNSALERGSLQSLAGDAGWRQEPSVPVCPVREQAVYVVAECALALIFFHEAGHVVLGHIRPDTKSPLRYQERARRDWWRRHRKLGPDQPTIQTRQREELQADRFAIAHACHHLRQSGGVFPGQKVIPALQPLMPNLLLVAQIGLHVLLADTDLGVPAFDRTDHPHPMTRLLDAVGSLVRTNVMPDAGPAREAGDAFRLASAMRRTAISAEDFDAMQRQAHDRLQRLSGHPSMDQDPATDLPTA